MDRACLVCQNCAENKFLKVREMMFGLRDEFEYMECAECGCVQICTVPEHLDRYYPPAYYPEPPQFSERKGLKSWLWRRRAEYCLKGRGIIGKILVKKYGRPTAGIFGRPDYYAWLQRCNVDFSSRILDIGCGLGGLLIRMHNEGFSDLTGLDPFIEKSIRYAKGLEIRKESITDFNGQFDLVMLHHTFEHMPDPHEVLRHLVQLLKPSGFVIIRIPVASSYAYKVYGANWAQLDAPRHLFLHTIHSMRILANKTRLTLVETVWDSSEFQFWASEQYLRDIPLRDERSFGVNPEKSVFTQAEIDGFKRHAAELNASGQGDSACFILQKPSANTRASF